MKLLEKPVDYFPSTLAKEGSFCNRTKERLELINNIQKCKHTVLVSPRRYGKTSLVNQVVRDNNIPCAEIDLYLAVDDASICKFITNGVEQVIKQIMPLNAKLTNKIQSIFQAFDISVKLGTNEFSLTFNNKNTAPLDKQYVEQIYEVLKSLSELAKSEQKIVLVFIDEFQEVIAGSSSNAIMGAIRHVAQDSEYLTFIFSGSRRHLLTTLFNEKSKPLYMMCKNLELTRIEAKEYQEHLNKLAQIRWRGELEQLTFEKIMQLTEAHAYYVNLLCGELWELDVLPIAADVLDAWNKCIKSEHSRIVDELNNLTYSQKDILRGIALYPTSKPTGIEFTKRVERPIATIKQTITSLLDKDLIYKIDNIDTFFTYKATGMYWVLDPMIRYLLAMS